MNTTSKLGAHTHTHPQTLIAVLDKVNALRLPWPETPRRALEINKAVLGIERLPASRRLRRALKAVHGREDALEHFAGKAVLEIELDSLPEALCRAFKIQLWASESFGSSSIE